MAEQTLGSYSFEDDPEKMTIPESKKVFASVQTYSGAAVFQWPANIAGQRVNLFWTLMSDEMYEELRTLYLSPSAITWCPKPSTTTEHGMEYAVAVVSLDGVYNDATFHHQPFRFDVKLVLQIISETELALLDPP
ncbi:MAG: hypothetical protein RBT11_19075 [Desulfobacterales bacterium]|jgi:hypothetical protein|nr:hypothetical protein [Desulfobacterales bacterium]